MGCLASFCITSRLKGAYLGLTRQSNPCSSNRIILYLHNLSLFSTIFVSLQLEQVILGVLKDPLVLFWTTLDASLMF